MHPNAQPLEEAQRQLSLMLQQQEELAPALYRDLALYLQVLREGLLPAVQQACFHLATQVVPERYAGLPEERRLQFQQRLASLVQRCSALLTVEQLMGLAAQQLQRDHRRRSSQRQQLLEAFLEGRDPEAEPDEAPLDTIAPPTGAAQAPQGSVHLGLDLPLSADLFDRGIPGLPRASGSTPPPEDRDQPEGLDGGSPRDDEDQADFQNRAPGAGTASDASSDDARPDDEWYGQAADQDSVDPDFADAPDLNASVPPDSSEACHDAFSAPGETTLPASKAEAGGDAGSGGDADLRLLQSLFQMAAEGLGQEFNQPSDGARQGSPASESGDAPSEESPADAGLMAALDAVASSDGQAVSGRMALSVAARIEPVPPPDPAITGSSLPRDPLRQVAWWRQFDRALSRRLRNLSHALNVEMMRLGLAQGLLPLNLLDAVLEGQVEALPAPANLLRLPLPLPVPSGGNTPTEVLALLLRSSDLEYEQPRLRTCRKRLEQRRRGLRTMAKRYRIWQDRKSTRLNSSHRT